MQKLDPQSVDVVLTSPPYNTSRGIVGGDLYNNSKNKNCSRYDKFAEFETNEDYYNFTIEIFNLFDRILKPNGVVLYNISYGSENAECMFLTIAEILKKTSFTIGDQICWKKNNAIPNNVSPNKLTRIWENVFVFCRKSEYDTYHCNKKVISTSSKGQKIYENIFNMIITKNNDENCPYNKATFSVAFCQKLLALYAPPSVKTTIYDPFMGSGTTAVACKNMEMNCYGSEISENQVKWALSRLENDEKPLFNEAYLTSCEILTMI
jgi:DNA modification methylase